MTVSLATLLIQQTKAEIYDYIIGIARALNLPVTSWQAGDPTRATMHAQSEALAYREDMSAGYIGSGFLDHAEGDWLTIQADQQFGVTRTVATDAGTDVDLSNASGGVYTYAVGDITFRNSTTGKTYRNTSGGTLAAKVGSTNGTLTVSVEADEAGSDSSAGAGEIDEMVTVSTGVTCTNPLAAVGVDEEDDATLRARCRARRARATPNGPRDAYTDVALDPILTGTTAITRARSYGDSDTGDVLVYLAGPSGAVAEVDRALVELAILENATPLCITPTVTSCTAVTVAVTYELWVYKRSNATAAEVATAVETELEAKFAALPIGGDIIAPATTGSLYQSLIASTIRETYPDDAFRVLVTSPAGDTALTNSQVAALGTVTATVNLVSNPT